MSETSPYKTLKEYEDSYDYFAHAYLFLFKDWEKAKKLKTIMEEKQQREKLETLLPMIAYMEQAMKHAREAIELLDMERIMAGFPPRKEER